MRRNYFYTETIGTTEKTFTFVNKEEGDEIIINVGKEDHVYNISIQVREKVTEYRCINISAIKWSSFPTGLVEIDPGFYWATISIDPDVDKIGIFKVFSTGEKLIYIGDGNKYGDIVPSNKTILRMAWDPKSLFMRWMGEAVCEVADRILNEMDRPISFTKVLPEDALLRGLNPGEYTIIPGEEANNAIDICFMPRVTDMVEGFYVQKCYAFSEDLTDNEEYVRYWRGMPQGFYVFNIKRNGFGKTILYMHVGDGKAYPLHMENQYKIKAKTIDCVDLPWEYEPTETETVAE